MNETLESSTNNLIFPWKVEYEQAMEAGISPDELLYNLKEELKLAECKLVWQNTNLENMASLETLAKQAINYDEKCAYLQNIIDSKCRKTM